MASNSASPQPRKPKAKIERRHDYGKKASATLGGRPHHRDRRCQPFARPTPTYHVNQHEIHRELGTTLKAAQHQARTEKHSYPVPPELPLVGLCLELDA